MKRIMVALPLLGLAACSMPKPTEYHYLQYQCGATELVVSHDAQADMVQFPYGGRYHKLVRVDAERGAKYSDGVTTFWQQAAATPVHQPLQQAMLTHQGVTLLDCERR
jgi:membrane-bound inhibitor of C-type lysozyme